MPNEEPREHLSDVANVYVTAAAAREFGASRGIPEETARRELTVLLLGAYKTSNGGWRRRIQSRRIDVTARVSFEGELAVVTAVSVRDYLGGAQQRRARSAEETAYPVVEERITLQTSEAQGNEAGNLRAHVAELEQLVERLSEALAPADRVRILGEGYQVELRDVAK